MAHSNSWKNLVSEKRKQQELSIPIEWLLDLNSLPATDVLDVSSFIETCGILDNEELAITACPVGLLLPRLASGELTAVRVTTAFYKRAIIAHQLTNCLTEIFVEKALAYAAQVDKYLARTGNPMGPLHGLPISLKDQINLNGIESTMGYVSWIGTLQTKDATLVEILKSLGAIPFVKTNVPQTLMWTECFNHVFGRTVNPFNRTLTAGGSSGGEGALIALKGSPIGVGSDIGGSIRIPAAYNGLYGLRPSYNRIPYRGCRNSAEGQDAVQSVLGPLSSSIEGIRIFMREVIKSNPWTMDPLVLNKPWNEEEYMLVNHGHGEKLCFGIMWDDEEVVPDPPITRALEITKQALETAGHRVIEWKAWRHPEINECLVGNSTPCAGAVEDYTSVTSLSGEPLISSMSLEEECTREPERVHRSKDKHLTAYQLWRVHKKRKDLREEYFDHWNNTINETGTGRPVDAIICPVSASVAMPHGNNEFITYTMVWNCLDYVAAVVPVKIDEQLDTKRYRDTFYGEKDRAHYEAYNPSTFAGAPYAIQVVGRTQEEEAVIAMSEIVDSALQSNVRG